MTSGSTRLFPVTSIAGLCASVARASANAARHKWIVPQAKMTAAGLVMVWRTRILTAWEPVGAAKPSHHCGGTLEDEPALPQHRLISPAWKSTEQYQFGTACLSTQTKRLKA